MTIDTDKALAVLRERVMAHGGAWGNRYQSQYYEPALDALIEFVEKRAREEAQCQHDKGKAAS